MTTSYQAKLSFTPHAGIPMSLSRKLHLITIPIFLAMTLASIIEIVQTRAAYQEDFDASLKTSMTVLSPAISTDIFNVDPDSVQKALYGIFSNKDILAAVVLNEDKDFFSGARKTKEGEVISLQDNDPLVQYAALHKDDGLHEFRVISTKSEERIYVYPLYNDVGYSSKMFLHGYLIIQATTHALYNRILFMLLRLVAGLLISFSLATLITRLILQIQVIKPIVSLIQASLDLAQGKFKQLSQIKEDENDEIYQLTSRFNSMANTIEAHLNLLRGMSTATQEIVRCQNPHEIYYVYFKHLKGFNF